MWYQQKAQKLQKKQIISAFQNKSTKNLNQIKTTRSSECKKTHIFTTHEKQDSPSRNIDIKTKDPPLLLLTKQSNTPTLEQTFPQKK